MFANKNKISSLFKISFFILLFLFIFKINTYTVFAWDVNNDIINDTSIPVSWPGTCHHHGSNPCACPASTDCATDSCYGYDRTGIDNVSWDLKDTDDDDNVTLDDRIYAHIDRNSISFDAVPGVDMCEGHDIRSIHITLHAWYNKWPKNWSNYLSMDTERHKSRLYTIKAKIQLVCHNRTCSSNPISHTDYVMKNGVQVAHQYRYVVQKQFQNTNGDFVFLEDNHTPRYDCPKDSTCKHYKHSNWHAYKANYTPQFKWNRNADKEYYASDTHRSNEKSDKNVLPKMITTTDHNKLLIKRYIYRKQYKVKLVANKQIGSSTPIVNQNPGDLWELSGSDYVTKLQGSGDTAHYFFVGEKVYNLPNTDKTYRMIGYSSSGFWYKGTGTSEIVKISGLDDNQYEIKEVGANEDTDPKNPRVDTFYAHWSSEPGKLYVNPNSKFDNTTNSSGPTDSCYAGWYNDDKKPTIYDKNIHRKGVTYKPHYDSNTERWAFDNGNVTLYSTPDIQNLTVHFSQVGVNANGEQSDKDVKNDFYTRKTDLSFDRWVESSTYDYYMKYYPASTLSQVLQCGVNDGSCEQFHGTLNGNTYTYTNASNWTDDSKGKYRNSIVQANYKGSWNIVLPNSYKTGYVFTGWYIGNTFIGMAGDTIDTSSIVRAYNTEGAATTANGSDWDITSTANNSADVEENIHQQLSALTLHPHFEPINYKILYIMNIPNDSDSATTLDSNTNLQSHTDLNNPQKLTGIHSLVQDTSDGRGSHTFGSTNPKDKDYSYIGSKTYTYDGSDWDLENMPITVNDYFFTGWTYEDIAWTGYGGIEVNDESNVTLGATREGEEITDCYYDTKEYVLKTLSMQENVVQTVKNNAPDTTSYSGQYVNTFCVGNEDETYNYRLPLRNPQTDGTNSQANSQASGLNNSNPTVYIVMRANWTSDLNTQTTPNGKHSFNTDLKYNSNNNDDNTYTIPDAYTKLIEYIDLYPITNNNLSASGFGSKKNTDVVSSSDTAKGDTSDDGSYDKNASTDTFVVRKNSDKYYSGISNGRKGFFSFQGWSTWRYGTWRDAIDSNKEDVDNNELQKSCGHDANSINATYQAHSLTLRRYNDVSRHKRVGDLYYRMSGVLFPSISFNNGYVNNNAKGNMVNSSAGTGDMYSPSLSKQIWNAYRWRWTKGNTGNYSSSLLNVLKKGITVYAVWDSYPTSTIQNTYCYISDIQKLTPGYLFSKVIATDYEDFWNQKDNSIGGTADGSVDWNTVATTTNPHMNENVAPNCPTGNYTYTYKIKGDSDAYLPGTFKATLCNYDYNEIKNATFVDDIASVSMTFRFVDSAGNTTYKTAWIYIIDKDVRKDKDGNDTDTNYDPHPEKNNDDSKPQDTDADNVRYSMTRFISEKYYNKAQFDKTTGDYVMNSAKESEGSLLLRSKWYINPAYRQEIQSAFKNLDTIGNSKLSLKLKFFDNSQMSDHFIFKLITPHAIWSGDYHPQYNDKTEKWDYDYDAIGNHTKGIYVLDAKAIQKTKDFIEEHGYDTGNYTLDKSDTKAMSGDGHTYSTIQHYIDEIFGDTGKKRITD